MKAWQKSEHDLAKLVGGVLVPGSGSSPMGGRGDVRTSTFLIEVKSTTTKRFRITKKLLDKTEQRAIKEGLEPALAVCVRGVWWIAVVYWREWKLFQNKMLAPFKAAARRDGVHLKTEKSLSGGPWVLIPLAVFITVVEGGRRGRHK